MTHVTVERNLPANQGRGLSLLCAQIGETLNACFHFDYACVGVRGCHDTPECHRRRYHCGQHDYCSPQVAESGMWRSYYDDQSADDLDAGGADVDRCGDDVLDLGGGGDGGGVETVHCGAGDHFGRRLSSFGCSHPMPRVADDLKYSLSGCIKVKATNEALDCGPLGPPAALSSRSLRHLLSARQERYVTSCRIIVSISVFALHFPRYHILLRKHCSVKAIFLLKNQAGLRF